MPQLDLATLATGWSYPTTVLYGAGSLRKTARACGQEQYVRVQGAPEDFTYCWRTVYLYLITHSLDFDVLFFGMRNNSLHLLLQLCDSRLLFLNLVSLFLHLAVFFEKLI